MFRAASRIAFLVSILPPATLWAFVEAKTPLSKIVADSHAVVLAKVQRIDTERKLGMLKVAETLVGRTEITQINVRLQGKEIRTHGVGPNDLLDRLEADAPVVVFITHLGMAELLYAYAHGTWFHLTGQIENGFLRARFENSEPFLRRTFHGDPTDLAHVLREHATSKRALPEVDDNIPPGLGPVLAGRESSAATSSDAGATQHDPQDDTPPPARGQSTAISSPTRRYFIGFALGMATLALVVMLTRSAPGEARSHE